MSDTPPLSGSGTEPARHPVTFSATPAGHRLPPPGPDEHGDDLRAWLAAPPRG